jgi:RimJ/RimL family protein N-acetyltransferase
MMKAIDLQPVLTGDLVLLRPIRADDWAEMYAAASDPLIWAGHPITDRWQEPLFRTFFDDAVASRAAFAIVERATGRIVGTSRYHGHDAQAGEIEIGWTFLTRDCWGRGHNEESKRLLLDHAFQYVDTVILVVGETNLRSRRAVEKIGGTVRARLERVFHGRIVQNVVYEIGKNLGR